MIGLELACAYVAFGTKITAAEALAHMLPMLDGALTKIGSPAYEEDGNRVPSGVRSVQSVEASPLGAAVVCRDKNGDTLPFEAEKVLVAVE